MALGHKGCDFDAIIERIEKELEELRRGKLFYVTGLRALIMVHPHHVAWAQDQTSEVVRRPSMAWWRYSRQRGSFGILLDGFADGLTRYFE